MKKTVAVGRDWKQIVKESNGRLVFCPDNLLEGAKKWSNKRSLLGQEVNKISKLEIETKIALDEVVYKIRKYFEEAGQDDAWTGEVGFETNALKEGLFVLSIDKNNN